MFFSLKINYQLLHRSQFIANSQVHPSVIIIKSRCWRSELYLAGAGWSSPEQLDISLKLLRVKWYVKMTTYFKKVPMHTLYFFKNLSLTGGGGEGNGMPWAFYLLDKQIVSFLCHNDIMMELMLRGSKQSRYLTSDLNQEWCLLNCLYYPLYHINHCRKFNLNHYQSSALVGWLSWLVHSPTD